MIKGKTKSGIEFSIDEAVLDDPRLLRRIQKFNNIKEIPPMEQINEVMVFLELLFGTGENLDAFLDEIAAHNGGKCNTTIFMSELNDIIESLKLKNSSSSPTVSKRARKI